MLKKNIIRYRINGVMHESIILKRRPNCRRARIKYPILLEYLEKSFEAIELLNSTLLAEDNYISDKMVDENDKLLRMNKKLMYIFRYGGI